MSSEEKLIKLLKEKDEGAFEIIYNKYYKLVYLVVNNIVQDKSASEELTTDTFMKMYNAINSFDTNKKFSSWLTTIARNTAINYVNRDKEKNVVYNEEIVNQVESFDVTTDASSIIASTLEGIECEVVKLKIVNDYTYQEISKALNISVSDVFRKYRNGIQKIKNKMRK